MRATLASASPSGSYSSRAAKPSWMPRVGMTRTGLRGPDGGLLGDGDDVLVVGQDHHLLAGCGVDGRQQVGGRGVHRLSAADHVVDAERPEDAPDALAGADGDDGAADRSFVRLQPRLSGRPPPAPSAPPRPAPTGRRPGSGGAGPPRSRPRWRRRCRRCGCGSSTGRRRRPRRWSPPDRPTPRETAGSTRRALRAGT